MGARPPFLTSHRLESALRLGSDPHRQLFPPSDPLALNN